MVFNNRKALVVAGGMSALLFALNLATGSTLTIATGIPIASILVTGTFFGFFIVLTGIIAAEFGSLIILMTLYSAFAIPTVLLGPPGVYKVAVGFLMGIGFDVPILLLKRRRFSYYIGLLGAEVVGIPSLFAAFIALGLPGKEQFLKLWPVVGIVAIVTGSLGIFLGQLIFDKKLKNLSQVKALMSREEALLEETTAQAIHSGEAAEVPKEPVPQKESLERKENPE